MPSRLHRKLLAASIEYHGREFDCVPTIGKKPTRRYKHLFRRRQTLLELRANFADAPDADGIALIHKNGVTCIDYDTQDGLREFKSARPDLARLLPSWNTSSAENFLCLSDHPSIVFQEWGEFRPNGISILPPSRYEDGSTRQWMNRLPDGALPFVSHTAFIPTPCLDRVLGKEMASDVYDVYETLTRAQVIERTQPKADRERNRRLLDLARGYKFNVGRADAGVDELRTLCREWHHRAYATIRTKAFDESWRDFLHAWKRARHALGGNLVDKAASMVDLHDLPECAMNYESDTTRILIGLCAEMSKLGTDRKFYLSSHDAAARLKCPQMTAYRTLQMLIADGVLECIDKGFGGKNSGGRRAARYRFIGQA